MLVYIDSNKDGEEFNTHREYAYVYEYEYDDKYEYKEDSLIESPDYEIDYEIYDDEYLVS